MLRLKKIWNENRQEIKEERWCNILIGWAPKIMVMLGYPRLPMTIHEYPA
jgi:hypothetical protein